MQKLCWTADHHFSKILFVIIIIIRLSMSINCSVADKVHIINVNAYIYKFTNTLIYTDCHSGFSLQPLTFTSKDGCLLLPSIQWMLLTDLAGDSQREMGEGVGSGRFPSSSRCLLRTAEIMLQQNTISFLKTIRVYRTRNYITSLIIYWICTWSIIYLTE